MRTYIQGSMYPGFPKFTQDVVNGLLEPIYPHLWRTIMEAWLEFQRYRANDPNFSGFDEQDAAQFMHSLIRQYAPEVFENNPIGAKVSSYYGKPAIIISEKIAVTIKKLKKRRCRKTAPEEELTRSHYDTQRSRKYWNNEPLDYGPNEPRVVVGYLLLRELTQIRIVVAYPRVARKGFIWSYLMPVQPNSILRARFTEETIAEPQEPGFKIDAKEVGKEGTSNA